MFHIIAADEDEAPPSIDGCRIDHRKPGLPTACGCTSDPVTAEPPHEPQRQGQEAEHHDEGEQHLEGVLSLAE
jgi:hypothetical protein